MKPITLLVLLLIKYATMQAVGGCGPAIIISNPAPQQYKIYKYIDTIRITLNPLDENISFELTQYSGDCQFMNSSWFKNGLPITGNDIKCVTSGVGIYTISTEGWGGSSPAHITVTIIVTTPVTSVDEESAGADIRVFPNPSAEGVFTIEKDRSPEPSSIAIYDLDGQIIKKMEMDQQKMTIDMSGFAKGVYFLEWTSINKLKRRKKIIFD
jgi:hypothetical protein